MAADKKLQPIIIRRKKAGHAGAHGGAWKVAYADFVTAMMAFFLVMWLLGSDDEVKSSVSHYFNNPTSALRPDLSSKDAVPLGDKTGAGDDILKGADGAVPDDLAQKPQRPMIDGSAENEDPSDVVAGMSSSGDHLTVEVVKFSVPEADLFVQGSNEKWTAGAPAILAKLGKLSKNYKGKLSIQGSFGDAGTGTYEFQNSRAVAVSKYIVEKKWFDEERIATSVKKSSSEYEREPAAAQPARLVFTLSP